MNAPGTPGGGPWFTGPADDPLRYRIDDLADGRGGGQGIVYPAWTGDGTKVALKLLSAPDLDFERVLSFTVALASVRHPNLVPQLDAFVGTALCEQDEQRGEGGYPFDVPYAVYEWVEGTDMTDAVQGASTEEILRWVADVARGVAALHANPTVGGGIVHRDVKPGNVRITPEGVAVLVDYGCARQVEGAPMTEGIGTPGWLAPEVVLDPSRVGQSADRWGVAAIAYWAFTGEPPLLVSNPEHRQRLELAARRAGVRDPARLAAAVAAGLATEQDARPTDLVGWANALGVCQRAPTRRGVRVVLAAGLLLVAVAAAGAVLWNRRGEPSAAAVPTSRGSSSSVVASPPGTDVPPASDPTTVPASTTTAGSGGGGTTISRGGLVPPGSTAPPTTVAAVTTTTSTAAPVAATPAAGPTPVAETTGGETHTWTNYMNAGGTAGPVIAGGTTVQISCKVTGFRVADGNTWWYRIASPPWNNAFYASADAFYNNGATSGPLTDTPFVDPAVPDC